MALETIDSTRSIAVDDSTCFNELRTLRYLRAGMIRLVNVVDRREAECRLSFPKGTHVWNFGIDVDDRSDHLDELACFFHWFGVSLCNYARLVGFLSALHSPGSQLTKADLRSDSGKKAIKKAVDEYVNNVPELQAVLKWRNKVGAHLAITDPRKDDNLATLDMSVMFPVCFSGERYHVGQLTLTVMRGNNPPEKSEIPSWSITEVFESLMPRFWPNVKRTHDERPSEPAAVPQ